MPIIVDNKINLEKTKDYRLSIQSNLNGFSFSVLDTQGKRCLYLMASDFSVADEGELEYHKKCLKMVDSIPLLRMEYEKVLVVSESEKYTLIPSSQFNEKDILRQLSELYTIEDDEEVSYKLVENLNLVIVFAANSTLLNIIRRAQSNFESIPAIYFVLKSLQSRPEHNKLYLAFNRGYVDISIFSGQQLMLCNSFIATEFSTALYYAFLGLKHSFINPENTTVFIHGTILESDIKLLSKYFPTIKYFRDEKIPLGISTIELQYSFLTMS